MAKQHIAFSIEDAEKFGVTEAILLSYFNYWIEKNTARQINEIEGRCYTYISYGRLVALFPFYSRSSLVRAVSSLVKQKAILLCYRSGAGVQGGRQMMITLSDSYRK